jgi:hypothetical protein
MRRQAGRARHVGHVTAALACAALCACQVEGIETRWWVADTAKELLAGRGDGVAVSSDGRLIAGLQWQDAVPFDEPVVMAAAAQPGGALIVGTGHPARLYRVRGDKKDLLCEVPGEQVTAVLATAGGVVWVASIAPGMLHRWDGKALTEVGRLGDGGIWDLAELDGKVIAAAGTPASLYRVAQAGLERWLELPDDHVRSMVVTPKGLVLGTSGKGLIFALDPQGRLSLIADSPFTEVSALERAPDGTIWATALVGEPEPSKPKTTSGEAGEGKTETASIDLDLPKVNGATASSEVLRLTAEGALLTEHRFTKQVATSLAWDGEGMVVGTGFEGEVWRFVEGGGLRMATVDAVQVVAITQGGGALLTQGPAQLLWREERPAEPRYRIDPLILKQPARFGEYRVLPPGDGYRIRFRSGASAKPDESWLPWSDWQSGATGRVPLPAARSLQWEIELPRGRSAAGVERIEVAYRDVNLPPVVKQVDVDDPAVVYLASPPPTGPVLDAQNPDVNGIFTVIDEQDPQSTQAKKGKKYYRVGYRTVSWAVEDANGDPVRATLEIEGEDGVVLPVRDELKGSQIAVDMTAVPDGLYRFRLTASDELENPGEGLSATGLSPWFVVDNEAPSIALSRQGETWVVTIKDRLSPLAKVEWARDGEGWQSLGPSDGVLDGREESFRLAAQKGKHVVVVRAIDGQHNRATAGAREE